MLILNPDLRTSYIAIVIALSFALLAGVVFAEDEDAQTTSVEPQMSIEEADELIAEIKELSAAADQALKTFTSSRLNQSVVLEEIDYEVEQIFEWIRSETRWVPYQGILRGAEGVLMDRCGNSLDRSLLLADLLENAGFETRLARASLSPEMAATLLESNSYEPPGEDAQISSAPELESLRAKQQEVAATARDLAQLAGFPASSAGETASDKYLSDISDHWWVQVEDGRSGWQDLDPMAPAGVTHLEAGKPSTYSVDELPEDLYHRLEVRVVIERWEAGRLVEDVPLSHSFAVAEVPQFTHFEIDFIPFAEQWIGLDEDDGGLDVLEIADSANFWRPSLKINGRTILGSWFNDSGTYDPPITLLTARLLESGAQALSTLDNEPEEEEVPDTHLTAVWFEFETSDPGGRGERVRREVFDLLGARRNPAMIPTTLSLSVAERKERGLAMLGKTSSLVLTSTPHADALERAALETWSENRNVFIALVYLASGRGEDERVPIALNQAKFQPVDLLAMASLREYWSRHRDVTHLDRTNVLSSHLIQVPQEDTMSHQFVTDVVINRIGVAPGAPLDARLVRLEQGVLDTLVETTFSKGEQGYNTYRYFTERSNGPGNWVVISADQSADDSLRSLAGGEISRILSAVREGNIVVASQTPHTLGDHQFASWWRIDSNDGTTLGMGYRGWGDDTAEYPAMNVSAVAQTRNLEAVTTKQTAGRACQATVEIFTEVYFQSMLRVDSYPAGRGVSQSILRMAGKGDAAARRVLKRLPCHLW